VGVQEHFAEQPEIEQYLNTWLTGSIFGVTSASAPGSARRVRRGIGHGASRERRNEVPGPVFRCRHRRPLGPLLPEVPGARTFVASRTHGLWPRSRRLRGKRVAVIGTVERRPGHPTIATRSRP